jgi:hypothetical protein
MRIDRVGPVPARTLLAITASLLLLAPSLRAAAADEKGSLSGTVRDDSNKPVAGLALRLEQDTPIDAKGKGGGKPGATKVIARATTDEKGNFSLPDLAPGTYRLVAGSRNVGWIYMDVTVTAGQETKLGELKLAKTG